MKAWFFLATLCTCVVAGAWEIQSLDVTRKQKQFDIQASLVIQAPPELIYEALTDFDNLDQLLKGIRESRQLASDESDTIQVFTKRRSCFFLFCFTSEVVEEVTYPEPGVIISTILPDQSDFKSGYMRWRLTQNANGTTMVYDAKMVPNFWIPRIIGARAIKRNMTRQLKMLGDTLEDRAGKDHG